MENDPQTTEISQGGPSGPYAVGNTLTAVVLVERERCAKIAEEIAVIHGGIYDRGTCERIAAAIRSGK